MRKACFFILYFIVFSVASADAGFIYSCIDRDGNTIITDGPQDGMKCVVKDKMEDSTAGPAAAPEEKEKEKRPGQSEAAAVKPEESREETLERMKKCYNCCVDKRIACYNFTANSRICNTEYSKCADTCNSKGASESEWSDCWPGSE